MLESDTLTEELQRQVDEAEAQFYKEMQALEGFKRSIEKNDFFQDPLANSIFKKRNSNEGRFEPKKEFDTDIVFDAK